MMDGWVSGMSLTVSVSEMMSAICQFHRLCVCRHVCLRILTCVLFVTFWCVCAYRLLPNAYVRTQVYGYWTTAWTQKFLCTHPITAWYYDWLFWPLDQSDYLTYMPSFRIIWSFLTCILIVIPFHMHLIIQISLLQEMFFNYSVGFWLINYLVYAFWKEMENQKVTVMLWLFCYQSDHPNKNWKE